MGRGANRGSGVAAAAAGGSSSFTSASTSSRGGGWTSNLRSLLFSPSPTKSPRKSRSKSTTPPPKNKRLSRSSARCGYNNNKDDEPLVPVATVLARSNSSLSKSSSTRSVGGGSKKTEASVRFSSSITEKSLLCQSIPPNRSNKYKYGPPAPSRDSENAQTVDKRLSTSLQYPAETVLKMDSSFSSVGSSSKQYHHYSSYAGAPPEKRRSFGEEIDGNHMVFDTSLVSMDSSTKDTTTAYTSSSMSTGGGGGGGMLVGASSSGDDHTTVASSSDGGGAMTDASSSVAHLRGWLDDFSKQQKKHYEEKSHKAPTDPPVKAPTRPKVGPTHKTKSVEVSVPEQAYIPAHPPTTLSSTPAPAVLTTPSVTKPSGSLSHHNLHHLPPSHHHPNHHQQHPPASALAKRLVDTGLSARSRTTPIRFKPKFQEDDVKATNEGYKSVAKLSAWLADDPTKPKKVRQIRRGANVIAKSRTFDKGLADVIVEQHNIPTGNVRDKKHLLETSISTHNDDDDEEEEQGLWAGDPLPSSTVPHTPASTTHHNSYYHHRQPESTTGRRDHQYETSSAISVNDKKAWLQNAFKKPDAVGSVVVGSSSSHAAAATSTAMRPKAKTDVITAQDQRDDVTARAKHMWRNRSTTTTAAASSRQGVTTASSNSRPVSMVSRLQNRNHHGEPTDMFHKQTLNDDDNTSCKTNQNDESMMSSKTNQNDESMMSLETSYIEEDSTDFSAARSLIVERAKQNGCPDVAVMTKVKLRQQKFEKMDADRRRRSSLPYGQLKPSWQGSGGDDTQHLQDASSSPSRTSYVKKYIDNAPPKKTLNDLP